MSSAAERRALARKFEAQAQEFASQHCGGDVAAAKALLDSLPYSTIPDCDDLRAVIEAVDRYRS